MPGDGVLDGLSRWAADASADEAARGRARERRLARQAEEEGTLAGALLDLAERGAPAVLHTVAGRRHRATIEAIGVDFCIVRAAAGRQLVLPIRALASVRPLAGEGGAPAEDRPVALDATLGDALDLLARDRARVVAVTGSRSDTLTGELLAVGRDVLTLRLDGDPRAVAYVPFTAVTEIGAVDAT